jgi:Putative translation factor (SUA5)
MLRGLVRSLPPAARALAERFWPGPLTLVLTRTRRIPDVVSAGLPTVAVRVPDHPVALALIEAAGVPVAAPSANRSGRPSPTRAAHVAADFPGLLVLDGGAARHGLESTVVSLGDPPRVLRLGRSPSRSFAPSSPVSSWPRRRVHAPRARGCVIGTTRRHGRSSSSGARAPARSARRSPRTRGRCSSAPTPTRRSSRPAAVRLGGSPAEIAHGLFDALRTERRGSVLLAYALPRRGLLRAVMDRLERAATRVV